MSLFKRSESPNWWVSIAHNGKRIQRSTGTKVEAKAQEYHDKLKASLWDEERLGIKPRHLWQDAVVRPFGETTHKVSRVRSKYPVINISGNPIDPCLSHSRSTNSQLPIGKHHETSPR